MEFVVQDVELRHLVVREDDAFLVGVGIEFAFHGEAGLGGGGANQIDDDLIADQRLGAPVHADEREQPVLDLVPFAGARRQVVYTGVDAKFVG